jgi:hypothetical protein
MNEAAGFGSIGGGGGGRRGSIEPSVDPDA